MAGVGADFEGNFVWGLAEIIGSKVTFAGVCRVSECLALVIHEALNRKSRKAKWD